MNLLVTGGREVDAGKTTFSVGLVARTGAVGYKPRAGNDYWFGHDDVLAAAEDGHLYGKDARCLAAAGPGDRDPWEINAIHRLWWPRPGGVGSILGRDGREFLLDRAGDTYVVNATVDLPDPVRSAFPVDSAVAVDTLEAFDEAMGAHHRPAQGLLADEITARSLSVVESYSDVARPVQSLDHDAVAVVEPRRVRVYDGRRYDRGCAVASGSPDAHTGRLEERTGDVTGLVDPVEVVELLALPGEQRTDPEAVADRYGEAYEALLRVAGS